MINQVHKAIGEKMDKTVSVLKDDLQTIRAGRANPHILDKVVVEYYGSATPLNQLANITVPEARMLQINPYDASSIQEIEKAIMNSDLGMNPSNDGKIIRLSIPMLTEDRRKELVKQVKKMGESAKVAIRNERREANDKLKKMHKGSELTDDDLKSAEDDVQKMTDDHIKLIDEIVKKKEAEILEV